MKQILKRMMAAFLCLTLLAAPAFMQPEEVFADVGISDLDKNPDSGSGIDKGSYEVTDISNLKLADIKGEDLVYTWNEGVNNVDFSCKIIAIYGVLENEIYSKEHVEEPQFTVKNSYLNKAEGHFKLIVQATDINGEKGKELSKHFIQDPTAKPSVSIFRAHRTKITAQYFTKPDGTFLRYHANSLGTYIQISTNKNFKDARTIQKPYKENGETKYKKIYEIKKLKPNTTYYIRRRYMKKIRRLAGYKLYPTQWSEPIKIKTLP